MTRINCVPVQELTDKHLGAEYRELPRLFGLVRGAVQRGDTADMYHVLTQYRLGPGHVLFFYPRLGYIVERYMQLVQECQRRGRTTNFTAPDIAGIPPEWFGYWEPTEEALALNRVRINQRIKESQR